jgi:hypothetical protein
MQYTRALSQIGGHRSEWKSGPHNDQQADFGARARLDRREAEGRAAGADDRVE